MTSRSHTETAVARVVDALVAAWNDHDEQAFARPFAADADFTNVFGMRARGRASIAAFHAPIFRTIFKDSRLVATDTHIRFLRPDVAAVDIGWEMTGARDPQGNEWPRRRGLMNLVVANDNGAWSIAVMHNMDLDSEDMAEAQAALQQEPA